jgi:hypothetical protein
VAAIALGQPHQTCRSYVCVFHEMPLRTVGEVVRYKFGFWPQEPRVTLSWMAFYGRTMFVVYSGPDDA